MEDLVKQLQQCGLTDDQVKQVFTIINNWTNDHYPVMGAVVESILRKNHLIGNPF
jgi:hypothetical protein